MNRSKDKAFELRKEGKSYRDIQRVLGTPKSTLSSWFKENRISSQIKVALTRRAQKRAAKLLRLMAAANKERWQQKHLAYRREAQEQFHELLTDPLFPAGICIYWGEGDKRLKNSIVRVSNTDARLLKIFTIFLQRSCGVTRDRLRAWLLLYPDLSEKGCKRHWSTILNIPQPQFIKSHFIVGRAKTKTKLGICTVQVYSRELKEKIITWIDLYSSWLQRAGIV